MNLDFTREEREFQQSIRSWMRENVQDDIKRSSALGEMLAKEQQQKWERLLGKQGWLALTWPKQYGGPGWTATQRYIFDLERAMAGAPRQVRSACRWSGRCFITLAFRSKKIAGCQVSSVVKPSGVRITPSPMPVRIWRP